MNANLRGLLESSCSVLGFEVGEVWFARKATGDDKIALRFHQLHISSVYEDIHRALIQPNINDGYTDETTHKVSPIMCRSACENGKIVWANAKACEGLVGTVVPLHTAVSVPAFRIGEDLCVVVLFSVQIIEMSTRAIQFLCSVMAAVPYYDKDFAILAPHIAPFYNTGMNVVSDIPQSDSSVDLLELSSPCTLNESDELPTPVMSLSGVHSQCAPDMDLRVQDMIGISEESDGSVQGFASSWSYMKFSDLWNPGSEYGGGTLVDGRLSYTQLKERYHELMIGLLHLTAFEITELWLLDECSSEQVPKDRLTVVAAFHTDAALQPWASFTRLLSLSSGLDFPGQVLQSGRPQTDSMYGHHHVYDPLYPRALHAKELGLRTAFGVPIPKDRGVCGALVFYARSDVPLPRTLVTMITAATYLLAGSCIHTVNATSSIPSTVASNQVDSAIQSHVPSNHNYLGEPEVGHSYEEDCKSLIDFAFNNALELFCDDIDSWANGDEESMSSNLLESDTDALITLNDGGRKRGRTLSRSSSFGGHESQEEGCCKRCSRALKNNAVGKYCHNCELLVQQRTTPSHPMITMDAASLHGSGYNGLPFIGADGLKSEFAFANHLGSGSIGLPTMGTGQGGIPVYQHFDSSAASHRDAFYNSSRQLSERQSINHLQNYFASMATSDPRGLDTKLPLPGTSEGKPSAPSSSKPRSAAKLCKYEGCENTVMQRSPYCAAHAGSKKCQREGCNKCAQGSTRFCIAHGGGRRCTHPGCTKGARDKFFCAAHGGGKRCIAENCNKSAVGSSKYCTNHGGGKRCKEPGCQKSAQSSTSYCVKHGGGRKCIVEGCTKVSRGRSNFCASHGGGVRCRVTSCNRHASGPLQLCKEHSPGGSDVATLATKNVVDSDSQIDETTLVSKPEPGT